MGYIAHHAIVVTGSAKILPAIHAKAVELFAGSAVEVSAVTPQAVNDTASLFIAPDGSKEGWGDSDRGNEARAAFVAWLRESIRANADWVLVRFGGDDGDTQTYVDDHSQKWDDAPAHSINPLTGRRPERNES